MSLSLCDDSFIEKVSDPAKLYPVWSRGRFEKVLTEVL